MKDKKVTAIILVAGNSTRYGQNKNKNLELLNNKTILEYSLNEFNKNKSLWEKFEEARNIFYAGNIEQAKILFEKISNELPVAKKYFERCEKTQTPIQENLKGIWVATEK